MCGISLSAAKLLNMATPLTVNSKKKILFKANNSMYKIDRKMRNSQFIQYSKKEERFRNLKYSNI